jgi:hypothetical protein
MGFLDRVRASFAQASGGRATLALELGQPQVRPGDTLDYRLVLTTSAPLNADGIRIGLFGRERVRSFGSGDEGPVRELQTFEHTQPVTDGNVNLPAGQTQEFHGTLLIPAEMQPTYRGIEAQHRWQVRATVVLPFGEDVIAETELIIR